MLMDCKLPVTDPDDVTMAGAGALDTGNALSNPIRCTHIAEHALRVTFDVLGLPVGADGKPLTVTFSFATREQYERTRELIGPWEEGRVYRIDPVSGVLHELTGRNDTQPADARASASEGEN